MPGWQHAILSNAKDYMERILFSELYKNPSLQSWPKYIGKGTAGMLEYLLALTEIQVSAVFIKNVSQ